MPILQHTVFIAPYLLPYPNLTVSLPLVYYSYLSGINNFYCCSEKRLTNLTLFRCPFPFLPCWDALPGRGGKTAERRVALAKCRKRRYLKTQEGRQVLEHSPPRVGHVPRESLGSVSQVSAPVGDPPPTGATALEVHKMNRHSRKNGGKPSCQHVPEEVSHGVSSFREAAPQRQPICEY